MSENFLGQLPLGLRTARVVEAVEGAAAAEGFVTVSIDVGRVTTARCLEAALTLGALVPGDQVLAAEGADRRWYVIGRLARAGVPALSVERNGADTVLSVDVGNLVLRAPASVRVEATDASGAVTVKASNVSVEAARAELHAADVKTQAERVRTEAKHVHVVAGVFEVDARRVIERAHDVYQEVRDQLQIKARRVRTVTEDAWTLLGQRVRVRSRGDVKVEGEKIYLG